MWIFRVVRDVLAWLGFLAVIAVALPFLIGPTWCSGDGCSVQGWFGALSGWAAAIAVACTIKLLWKQTNEAARAADIGQQALEHAQQISKAQLRAYIFLITAKFKDDDGKVQLVFQNTGSTPARNMKLRIEATITSNAANTSVPIVDPGSDHGPLAPNDTFTYVAPMLGPKIVDRARSGKEAIVFDGVLNYEDVFGEPRTTRFRCFTYAENGKIAENMNSAIAGSFFD